MILLTRAIAKQELDFYMPISKVDANMHAAHARDAVTRESFWFRHAHASGSHTELTQLSISEVINGCDEKGVVGLLQRARQVLDVDGCVGDEREQLDRYLSFVGQRAAGQLKTTACWLREQAVAHPDYRRDSIVTDDMCHDLMARCAAVASGALAAPELLPSIVTDDMCHVLMARCAAVASGALDSPELLRQHLRLHTAVARRKFVAVPI
jgi:glutamate--cysteine ligase catalytic subunit